MEGCKERAREGGEVRGRKLKVSFSRIFLIYLLCSGLGREVKVSKCCEYNSEWICLPFFFFWQNNPSSALFNPDFLFNGAL